MVIKKSLKCCLMLIKTNSSIQYLKNQSKMILKLCFLKILKYLLNSLWEKYSTFLKWAENVFDCEQSTCLNTVSTLINFIFSRRQIVSKLYIEFNFSILLASIARTKIDDRLFSSRNFRISPICFSFSLLLPVVNSWTCEYKQSMKLHSSMS